MNWKVRMRNPWFWVGIVSAVVSVSDKKISL